MSDYGTPPQPPAGYGHGEPPGGPPPPNYLVVAILSTVLCCLPLGIVAIVFAAQVNSKWAVGDLAGARQSSANAKKFAIISVVGGLALYVVLVAVVALFAFSLRSSTTY